MPEKVVPGSAQEDSCIREAVCIHTKKIYDSCKDKDCIEDLRLYPVQSSLPAIEHAVSIKAGTAELLYSYIDVEPVNFNRGFYTVDVRYFYRITCTAYVCAAPPVVVTGLAVFDKRCILFGSEGAAKIFSSRMNPNNIATQSIRKSNLPIAVVEAVDPIILNVKLVDVCDCHPCECETADVPNAVAEAFDSSLVFCGDTKRIYVTLGQFSIIRLERESQLLVPVYDYCLPDKECNCSDDDPCEVFRQVRFPVDEFFPPNVLCSCGDDYRQVCNNSNNNS